MTTMKILTRCILVLTVFVFSVTLAQSGPFFDPERWENAISTFEAQDRQAMPPEGAILFTGSSSIRFWHDRLTEDMAGLTVIPRGYGGSTMQDSVYYIERLVFAYKPRAIVLYQGDNDIGAYHVPPTQVRDLYQLFVSQVHDKLPDTRIYVLAVKPSILREADWPEMQKTNALLKEFSDTDDRLMFIDIAMPMLTADGRPNGDLLIEDNLHMNSKGYDIWASVVRPILMDREAQYE